MPMVWSVVRWVSAIIMVSFVAIIPFALITQILDPYVPYIDAAFLGLSIFIGITVLWWRTHILIREYRAWRSHTAVSADIVGIVSTVLLALSLSYNLYERFFL